ncbi:MAG: Triacylglycerol lipase (Lipase)-like protein [Ramlibacter sp.]|nr:Triacylglycerol lipase (Lipase)-like protein [Ramlibacter sp.]
MRSVLERLARAGHAPLYTLSPQQARAAYEAGAGVLEVAKPALPRVADLAFTARDGGTIPLRLYAPAADRPLPVLVYFHGGGFTIGSIASHDALCRTLATLSACAVLSVGYRLAPEHRFPTAVHDAWDAVQWLAGEAAALQLDGQRLALGGDSAGGTLATVCATLARDAGLPIRLQLLFYPGCAAWPAAPSHARYHQGLVLEQAHIEYFFRHYVDDAQREDWRFAPLNTPDVDGVAPAWFGRAECDPLVDDGLAYADKLRAAGVPVDLEIYRGVTHEFIKMGRALPQARQAHADAAAALQRAMQA